MFPLHIIQLPLATLLTITTAMSPAALRGHPAANDMTAGALTFLESLTADQRTKATIAFASDERENWHYVPRRRAGLTLREMTERQRELAFALVRTALSARGFEKVSGIVALESVLADLEGGRAFSFRDPGLYTLLIAGTPDIHGTWGWRFEGHHLSVNITLVRGEAFAVTPSFLGANPAEIKEGPRRGERVLAEEEDLGRELVNSLNESQRATAIIANDAPHEILTGAARRVDPLSPDGLPASALDESQRATLMQLVETYVRRHRAEFATLDLEKVHAAGVGKIHFAWAGGLSPGQGHYYRVQGPTFLFEYDNTQNGANHIHTVWRSFEGDFGRDLLLEHHQSHHMDASSPDGR